MNSRRALQRALPVAGTVVGVGFLIFVARPHWDAVRAASRNLDAPWIALGVLGLAAHLALSFAIWRMCLSATGAALTVRAAADTWVPSLLARYVPGRIWAHGVRVMLARRAGVTLTAVTAAVGWEILMALSGAGVVALIASSGTTIDARVRAIAAATTLACVVALTAAQLLASRSASWPLLARVGLARPVPAKILFMLAAAHLGAWTIYGAAHWAFARAIGPLPLSDIRLVTAGVALAWIGGYVAVFTPAGLGVREGLLALLLGPALGAGPVVLLAGVSRVATIAVELLLFAAWNGLRIGRPKDVPNPPADG